MQKALLLTLCLVVAGQSYWIYTIRDEIYDDMHEVTSRESVRVDTLEKKFEKLSDKTTDLRFNGLYGVYDVLEEHDKLLDKFRDFSERMDRSIENQEIYIEKKRDEEMRREHWMKKLKEREATR